MAELGIIPSPDTEGYLELAGNGEVRRFRKHLLSTGPLIHPKTGKIVQVDDAFIRTMQENFNAGVCDIVSVPLADKDNRHSEAPERNTGRVVGLEREGGKVYAVMDIADPEVAGKLGSTLLGASAMISLDYTDTRTGRKVGPTLLHSCITNRPYCVGLEDYSEVLAATARDVVLPDGSVWSDAADPLMLCYSEADPPELMLADPEPEPDHQPEPDYRDYGGAAGMDEQYLRDEAARLGLEAMQLGSGRGSKPQYGMVITDRDRSAALSAQQEQLTDEAILGLTRELADEYHVSSNSVLALCHDTHIRSGLGRSEVERVRVLAEVGLALSRGQLEVSDDAVLALSQAYGGEAEVLRLTAEPGLEDMFGLAHPQKSGKNVTTRTRAHGTGEDPSFDVEAEIKRLLAKHAHEFGAQDRGASSGNRSDPAKSPGQREAGQRRALAGGRPGGRSIGELHPQHAPGHHESGSVRA